MSYDINYRHKRCAHCGERPASPDGLSPTYNVGEMFYASLSVGGVEGGIHGLHGKRGGDIMRALLRALAWLDAPESQPALEKMQPENGWGDTGTVRHTLATILSWARAWPDGVVDTRYGQGLDPAYLDVEEDTP